MHRANGVQVLVDHQFGAATALGDISLQAADETDIGICIDEDFDIEKAAQLGFGEDQNSFDQDDRLRIDEDGLRRPEWVLKS